MVVGKEEKTYYLHHSVGKTSDFLTSAIIDNGEETGTEKIKLPHVDTKSFDLYVHWLYTGTLLLTDLGKAPVDKMADHKPFADKRYARLMHLYVLAHDILDRAFQNVLITARLETYSQAGDIWPGISAIKILWDRTPTGCMMKRLILRFWAHRLSSSTQSSYSMPHEFAVDLLHEMVYVRKPHGACSRPNPTKPNEYHESKAKDPTWELWF